jgi:hypothetical protein
MDRLPLLGRIAAGKPVEAIETAETISLSDIIGSREVYALEVRGDSMRDEHIVSGDYVLVERTRTAREGEIVVALIDGTDAALQQRNEADLCARRQRQHPGKGPWHAPQICLNAGYFHFREPPGLNLRKPTPKSKFSRLRRPLELVPKSEVQIPQAALDHSCGCSLRAGWRRIHRSQKPRWLSSA